MIRTNGILCNPETGEGYSQLPVSAELRSLIRAVHSNTGNPQFEVRYANPERRSAPPIRSNSAFHRPDELAREKLRLRLSLLQRMRA
jgi:hypothetical protein